MWHSSTILAYIGLVQVRCTDHALSIKMCSWCLQLPVQDCGQQRLCMALPRCWGLLGTMPHNSKAATVAQTDEWISDQKTRLYHLCIDILAQQINYFTGRDGTYIFGLFLMLPFLDVLCMVGVANGTMCPTTHWHAVHDLRVS
jgi:hypothetical protein